ncbi:MAG: dolichol-phosphate mannosyltransferase [Phycisphaerales bacterium]|jgi:dolichol-phosphate mannosyltransferase|nr:dolichol-phosphate mannosyltransferase [Phycisphaerales bacterium]
MTPLISLVIPALNEAPNLPPLLEQIAAALAGRDYEVIVVDDNSRDDTKVVCAKLAQRYPLRLIVRERPMNGLSGAVLHGIADAKGEYLVVMDADLQHPPAKIPELLAPLERGEADFVIGSRYIAGGTTGENWGFFRRINSRVAMFLARPFAGRTADPMSGFFALKRSTFDRAQRLTPLGYKIALELMCKSRVQNVREIPIHFAERTRGESKLTLKEQFRYLEHLSRLYDFTFPRASPIAKFIIVLAVSWFVGLMIFIGLTARPGGASPVAAAGIAYAFALAVTAVFHLRYVRTQREFIIRPRPWLDFVFISAAELLVCVVAAKWVASRVAAPTKCDLFVIPFLLATVVRYVLRKELLQDVRGLRREVRKDELT